MSNGEDIDPDDADDVDEPGLSAANRLWRIRHVQRRFAWRLRSHDQRLERIEHALVELQARNDHHHPPRSEGSSAWMSETMIKIIVSAVVTLILSLALGRLFVFPPG